MKLVTVTLWLLGGAVLTAGAYWSFLITPESTAWTLAASALLALTAALLACLTISGAITGWQHAGSSSHLRAAVAGTPAVIPGVAIALAIWWLVDSATDRVTVYSGPINGWFIAIVGWDDVGWLFRGIEWLAAWLKWVVAPMFGLSAMAGILEGGWRVLSGTTWISRALAPVALGIATVVFAGLVAAPWQSLVPWRPAGLPATSIELAFILAKLSLTAVLMAFGAALIIRQAAPKRL